MDEVYGAMTRKTVVLRVYESFLNDSHLPRALIGSPDTISRVSNFTGSRLGLAARGFCAGPTSTKNFIIRFYDFIVLSRKRGEIFLSWMIIF